MEGLEGVDLVLVAWTIAIPAELVDNVKSALAVVVAPIVVALGVRSIAGVWGGRPTPLVGLLDVHLGAVSVAWAVGVTVEVAVGVPEAAVGVKGGDLECVESVEAAAFVCTEVDIVLDVSTNEVGLEEVWVAGVEVRAVNDEAAVVHVAGVG